MIDNYRHKGLRKKLVEKIKEKGIDDLRILNAIGEIPRHYFLDRAFEEWAYKDTAFPIGCQQTISQPFTVAYQTTLLDVKEKDKILEIGTGSGYQAVVLMKLGAKVYSIERQEKLFHNTNQLLKQMGHQKIRLFLGDGTQGLPRFAPFDKIIVTAAAKEIPEALKEQLKIGGYLVIPVGGNQTQSMLRICRISESKYKTEKFDQFRFVPLLTGVKKKEN